VSTATAETASYPCTTDGCTGRAKSRYGRYSKCGECQARAAQAKLRAAPEPAPSKAKETAGFEEKAKELVKAGRRVDRAAAKLAPAQLEARQAVAAFKKLARDLAEGTS
jgi:hypothetical protein